MLQVRRFPALVCTVSGVESKSSGGNRIGTLFKHDPEYVVTLAVANRIELNNAWKKIACSSLDACSTAISAVFFRVRKENFNVRRNIFGYIRLKLTDVEPRFSCVLLRLLNLARKFIDLALEFGRMRFFRERFEFILVAYLNKHTVESA